MEAEKTCIECGATFTRPKGISTAFWLKRVRCGEACRRVALGRRSRELAAAGTHPAFKGERASRKTGHTRARVAFSIDGMNCARCPAQAEVRHHVDEDTHNNEPSNIEFLCRACHLRHHNPIAIRWARARAAVA